jgi:hypothetical protein
MRISLAGQRGNATLSNEQQGISLADFDPEAPPKTASLLGAGDDDLQFIPDRRGLPWNFMLT